MLESGVAYGVPNMRLLRSEIAKADIVHVHLPFPLGIASVAIARKTGVPSVATMHMLAEHMLWGVGVRARLGSVVLNKIFNVWVYDRCDLVICPSLHTAAGYRCLGGRTRTSVISNGVPGTFVPAGRTLFASPIGQLCVLSVGRLAPEKNHEFTIRSVARMQHKERVRLTILGEGPMYGRLRHLGERLLGARFRMFSVPPETMPEHYQAADVLVHSSTLETEGMSVMEALVSGVPALISLSPMNAAMQFSLGPGWLFSLRSEQSLAAKLDRLVDSPQRLEVAKAEAARQGRCYSIDNTVSSLCDEYSTLLLR